MPSSFEKKFKLICAAVLLVMLWNSFLLYQWDTSFELDISDVQGAWLVDVDDASQNNPGNKPAKKDDVIHIMTMVDQKFKEGLPVLISSVLRNTNRTVIFHIGFCQKGDDLFFKRYLSCFRIPKLRAKLLNFVKISQEKLMDSLYRDYLAITTGVHENLGSCSDLLRLKAHKIFPYLDKALWLDVDMLVLGDISELWNSPMNHSNWVYVAKTFNYVEPFKMAFKYSKETFEAYETRYNTTLAVNKKSYNNGVTIFNLKLWKQRSKYFEEEIEFWMKKAMELSNLYNNHKDKSWWFLGNQPLMWLVFQEDYGYFKQENWHIDGLGHGKLQRITPQKVANAKLLHWNGDKKPWRSNDALYKSFWEANVPKSKTCVNIGEKRQSFLSFLFGDS